MSDGYNSVVDLVGRQCFPIGNKEQSTAIDCCTSKYSGILVTYRRIFNHMNSIFNDMNYEYRSEAFITDESPVRIGEYIKARMLFHIHDMWIRICRNDDIKSYLYTTDKFAIIQEDLTSGPVAKPFEEPDHHDESSDNKCCQSLNMCSVDRKKYESRFWQDIIREMSNIGVSHIVNKSNITGLYEYSEFLHTTRLQRIINASQSIVPCTGNIRTYYNDIIDNIKDNKENKGPRSQDVDAFISYGDTKDRTLHICNMLRTFSDGGFNGKKYIDTISSMIPFNNDDKQIIDRLVRGKVIAHMEERITRLITVYHRKTNAHKSRIGCIFMLLIIIAILIVIFFGLLYKK